MSWRDKAVRCIERVVHSKPALGWRLQDVDERTRAIYHRVAPYTMTSPERIVAVCDAASYVTKAGISGAYVECGVWRGGSSMAAALSLMAHGDSERQLCLFDTFEGMSAPSEHDLRARDGTPAANLLRQSDMEDKVWCRASLEDVAANMASTEYPRDRITYCKGRVEETLPAQAPEQIAILRLDTDWYESTRHELEYLYPRLAIGGVLIVDDYGYWAGARKAVDEFFAELPILLSRVDRTGRTAVKVAA